MFHILNEFVFYHLFIAPFQSHTHTHTHAHTHTFTSSPSFSPHCDRPPPHPLLPPTVLIHLLTLFFASSFLPSLHSSLLSLFTLHLCPFLPFNHSSFFPPLLFHIPFHLLEMFPTTYSFLISILLCVPQHWSLNMVHWWTPEYARYYARPRWWPILWGCTHDCTKVRYWLPISFSIH